MKRLVIGILAHVDAGKTTLSEGLLYAAGAIRQRGRVDHGDAFLDTNAMERQRGITIFSKQAMLEAEDFSFTLLDTPGHVDFSAEMERSLRVMDYAVLVISGADGVQSHTETLWKLLKHYDVPTFLFVNKMDLPTASKKQMLAELSARLDTGCIDFEERNASFFETAAMESNMLLDAYLETGTLSPEILADAISAREIFPCYFGSALKHEGVSEFLEEIARFTQEKQYPSAFGAKIFKITEDDRGQRLTHMKITGGQLPVKAELEGEAWKSKINEIRIYSGAKYKSVPVGVAGSVCVIPGLDKTFPREGLGIEKTEEPLLSEPVLTFGVDLPGGTDILSALSIFRKLEEEETQMHVLWNPALSKIDVQVMGEVQLEVIKEILRTRFSLPVTFTKGSIIYKETIADRVEGVGHFEPLRHYAEVHLRLEAGKRGSGLMFDTDCSEDVLAKNWQRLILTHLGEKIHKGVLTGAPLTDVKITLLTGKAHPKHTEGGDFRQATYRAVRQGLMQAESILLEPWYTFALEIPQEMVGRAMTDLERMGATFSPPEPGETCFVLRGRAPISKMREYHMDVVAYSHGRGRLTCAYGGYDVCTDAETVIREIGYDPEGDVENTADSVFCSHGAGVLVKWDAVFSHMHLAPADGEKKEEPAPFTGASYQKLSADDASLLAIYERTYGKIKERTYHTMHTPKPVAPYKGKTKPQGPVYLLVDGYNIIFAWEELAEIAKENLETARSILLHRLCNYQAIRKNNVIVVFDAYKVKGGVGSVEQMHGNRIVYTKEARTADAYIEKTSKVLSKAYRVRVATSDRLEQIIVFGHGTERVSAAEFLKEVEHGEQEMRDFIEKHNRDV